MGYREMYNFMASLLGYIIHKILGMNWPMSLNNETILVAQYVLVYLKLYNTGIKKLSFQKIKNNKKNHLDNITIYCSKKLLDCRQNFHIELVSRSRPFPFYYVEEGNAKRDYIELLTKRERVGYARLHRTTYWSLLRFFSTQTEK